MTGKLSIFCLVVNEDAGKAISQPFEVEADKTISVSRLKEEIKKKKPRDFQGVDADNLTLWGVSIPYDETLARALTDMMPLQEKTGVRKLNVMDNIEVAFSGNNKPERRRIHVLVVPPATTGKSLTSLPFLNLRCLPCYASA